MSETTSRMSTESTRDLRKWCLERAQLESHQHVIDLVQQAAQLEMYVLEGENVRENLQIELSTVLGAIECDLIGSGLPPSQERIITAVFKDIRKALKAENLINPNNT